MRYSVILLPIREPGFEGQYLARIPALDLTTHGKGVEGAVEAARDLARLWAAEQGQRGLELPLDNEVFLTQIEVDPVVPGGAVTV
jgi:predicted RNase H-like HicB family nuclease